MYECRDDRAVFAELAQSLVVPGVHLTALTTSHGAEVHGSSVQNSPSLALIPDAEPAAFAAYEAGAVILRGCM